MLAKSEMEQGWDFTAAIMGADIAAQMGSKYVGAVEAAIEEFENNLKNSRGGNRPIAQQQGFVFEEWAAGTFNIDAAAAGSSDQAMVLHSTAKNSVDIQLKSGTSYSAKSYADAEKSVKAQAKLNNETRQPSYLGQKKLVPSDQLPEARILANKFKLKNQTTRPEVAASYSETEKSLTDVVSNDKGVSSKSVTRDDLDTMTKEIKKGEFSAEKHKITAANSIRPDYMIKQAAKAGATAAAVTLAFQLAPEIYKSIDYLIHNGELDIQQLQAMGSKGISAGAEGFLRGSVSYALQTKFQSGVFGEAFMGVDPTLLGTAVAVVMQTVKNSILVAVGKMSAQEMGVAFEDTLVISCGYLLGAKIGGAITQALLPEIPVAGYLLGSLIGTSLCVVYNIGKKKFISFCIDTGFTCFGLVDQNYELPEQVLHELGIETIPIKRTQVERTAVPRAVTETTSVNRVGYETIEMTELKRGIIGVNRIGYIIA